MDSVAVAAAARSAAAIAAEVAVAMEDRSQRRSRRGAQSPARKVKAGAPSTPVKRRSSEQDGGGRTISPTKKKVQGTPPSAKRDGEGRRGIFGRDITLSSPQSPFKPRAVCSSAVQNVYSLVLKASGAVGGNGYFGAIYGELTMGSMQKMVDLMKKLCAFDSDSTFIDVGSGLGRPNFHVAQDPGVKLSFGLELESIRWQLSIANLRTVMQVDDPELRQGNVFFSLGDVTSASSFDPFTHVYMFDIGFPPETLQTMAEMFNRSKASYLINYHSPRYTILRDGYAVELVLKVESLKLTGSGESHTGYIYKRKGLSSSNAKVSAIRNVDPLFKEGADLCAGSTNELRRFVEDKHTTYTEGGRSTRKRAREEAAELTPE